MNTKDDVAAAKKALQDFKGERIIHFYDSQHSSGTLIANDLPINKKEAWDIYLFYPKEVTWEDRISFYRAWWFMHGLS